MKEQDYYEIVKLKIEALLNDRISNVHLEITAAGKFSPKLKKEVPQSREIIFSFLKGKSKAFPDITGFIKGEYITWFIIIEVKKEEINLDDIYQSMKYRDLFDSKFTFLVSLKPIKEEIKRFCRISNILIPSSIYQFFCLAEFDEKVGEFIDWFRENPFEKETYWK
jgi:hypothetical protein